MLLAAVDALDGVALDLIEQVTYDKCLGRKAACHALVDQFTFGYGNNAIEAWAMGQPVIGGVCDVKYRDVVLNLCGYLPYLDTAANVKAIRANILNLKNNLDLYKEMAEIGRKYFFQFHHAPVVAEKAIEIYEQAMVTKPRSGRRGKAVAVIHKEPRLKVLQVGEWDYAGCGYFLAQALKVAGHESRVVRWAVSALQFPVDIVGPTDKEFLELWQWADVIHIHDALRRLAISLPPKPTVITHHGTVYRRSPQAIYDLAKGKGWLATVARMTEARAMP
jgi:glycosyltransferase involved in cell wall biosynthesis